MVHPALVDTAKETETMSEGNGQMPVYPPTIIDPNTNQPIRTDSWVNALTGLGTDRDKRTFTKKDVPQHSNNFQEFENLYHGDDMSKKTVDAPAHEMIRKWFTVNIDDTVEKATSGERREVESDVAAKVDVSGMMNRRMMDLKAPTLTQESIVWGKVFGGSLMLLGVDDGQELVEPLNEDNVTTFTHLTVFDRWEISVRSWYDDPNEEKFGSPKVYEITQNTVPGGVVLRTGKKASTQALVHETRFLRFEGANTNRRRRIRQNGWADSVYIPMLEVIRDSAMTWGSAAHLITDFAQAIFKLKNLGAMLKSDTEGLVIKRLMMMDAARSVTRMVPIDAEHEDFMRQTTPMTGLSDMMELFIIRFAAAARMPVSVLFGVTLKAGMNQSGESDLSIWRDQIRGQQEAFLRPLMEKLVRLLFKSKDGPTAGKEPEKWSLKFNPLQELNELQESERRQKIATTDAMYLDRSVVSAEEIAQSRFGGDTYSSETMLDTKQRLEDALANQVTEREFTGIQVEKFISIMEKVAANALTSEAAEEALVALFGIEREIAQKVLGSLKGFEPEFIPSTLKPKTTGGPGDDPFARNAAKGLPPALKAQQAEPGDPFGSGHEPDDKTDRFDVVTKEGKKYVVRSKDGKKLGEHDSEEDANKQLRAIETSKRRGDAVIEPQPEVKPNDHLHVDPEGGLTGSIIDVEPGKGSGNEIVPMHVHKRPNGLGSTAPAPTGVLHTHGTDEGNTGKNLDLFNPDRARVDSSHPTDGPTGVCDKSSPNYDPAECARRRKAK